MKLQKTVGSWGLTVEFRDGTASIPNFAPYDTYVRIGIAYDSGDFKVYRDSVYLQSVNSANADQLNTVSFFPPRSYISSKIVHHPTIK